MLLGVFTYLGLMHLKLPAEGGIIMSTIEVAEPSVEAAAILKIWREYEASVMTGDTERFLAMVTDDFVQMPPGSPARHGKDELRPAVAMSFQMAEYESVRIDNEEVRIAGEWAYARGAYTMKLKARDGGARRTIDGKYMSIFARQSDGSWKLHRDIFNTNS